MRRSFDRIVHKLTPEQRTVLYAKVLRVMIDKMYDVGIEIPLRFDEIDDAANALANENKTDYGYEDIAIIANEIRGDKRDMRGQVAFYAAYGLQEIIGRPERDPDDRHGFCAVMAYAANCLMSMNLSMSADEYEEFTRPMPPKSDSQFVDLINKDEGFAFVYNLMKGLR